MQSKIFQQTSSSRKSGKSRMLEVKHGDHKSTSSKISRSSSLVSTQLGFLRPSHRGSVKKSMPKEDVIGKKIQDIFHEKSNRIFSQIHNALYQTLETVYKKFRAQHKKTLDLIDKERKKLLMIKLKKKQRYTMLGRNGKQRFIIYVKIIQKSLDLLKSIHNDNDFYRVKKIFDLRMQAKDDQSYQQLLRNQIDKFISSPYKGDLIFSLKYLKAMVRTDYAKFGKIVCEILIETIFPYLIQQRRGDQVAQSLVLQIITLLLSKEDARADLYQKNILLRFFENYRVISQLEPELQDKISWLATSICHHEELIPFIIDIGMLDLMTTWIDQSKYDFVKSNVMLAFGLLTDWKEMAPYLIDLNIIDTIFDLCRKGASQTRENAYLALAQFGLRQDLISSFAEKPVVDIFGNFHSIINLNIQTNICWLFVAMCNGTFSGRQLLLWSAIPAMLRACCSPKYESLYHIIIAGFVARGMQFGQGEVNPSTRPSVMGGVQNIGDKAGGALSNLLLAVNTNNQGTSSSRQNINEAKKLSKMQQHALAVFEKFNNYRHKQFIQTLLITARHNNQHKKMLGFKGIKAYLNSVKNIPVKQIVEMMAILIEASFSKNKDIILSASEAFTYAVTQYLKVWKQSSDSIPLLVKGLLQYTSIDIKVVQQRAFSLLLVICYFGKEHEDFGKAVLQTTSLPQDIQQDQFYNYNTKQLHSRIQAFYKDNKYEQQGMTPTLFGLKPILELLMGSTKKRQSEILKDICKMLKKESIELDGSIFQALELFFRYRDKNIIQSLATAFQKVSQKLITQDKGDIKVDGSLLLKYFSLIQNLIENNVEICLKVTKSLLTITDLFSVDISDCAKVVIDEILVSLNNLQKFFVGQPPNTPATQAKVLIDVISSPQSATGSKQLQVPVSTQGDEGDQPTTPQGQQSIVQFNNLKYQQDEGGLNSQQLTQLLQNLSIFDSDGAVYKINDILVRVFINLMTKQSGSLLITYEQGIQFTKTLIIKSTTQFPLSVQDQIRSLVNARIKSFRFQQIFLDAGFYKYVKQLFNVKNQDRLKALIKIYEILITLNFQGNTELVDSILGELAEILAFSQKDDLLAQIIAIFISVSPQSLRFVTLSQLSKLEKQMLEKQNINLFLQVVKLIIILLRDSSSVSLNQNIGTITQIVSKLINLLDKKNDSDDGTPSSNKILQLKYQRRKIISILLMYAQEMAIENIYLDISVLKLILQAVLHQNRNQQFLMQFMRICQSCCGSLSMDTTAQPSSIQKQISSIIFESCDDILHVIQKSGENYYCKVIANDLLNLAMLMNLGVQTKDFFSKLTTLFNHQIQDIGVNSVGFFGSYFVIHDGMGQIYEKLKIVDLIAGIVLQGKHNQLNAAILGIKVTSQIQEKQQMYLQVFASISKVFRNQQLLANYSSKEHLCKRIIQIIVGTKSIELLESIFKAIEVMMVNEEWCSLFLGKDNFLKQIKELLLDYSQNPIDFQNLILIVIGIIQISSRNIQNHTILLQNKLINSFYLIFQKKYENSDQLVEFVMSNLNIEIIISRILQNLMLKSEESVIVCIQQNVLQLLEFILKSENVDYRKGVMILNIFLTLLENKVATQVVVQHMENLKEYLIEVASHGKYLKHRKLAEGILQELGFESHSFIKEEDMLSIFKQFGIGAKVMEQ